MKINPKTIVALYEVIHTLGKKRSIEWLVLLKKWSCSYSELQKKLWINSKLVAWKIKELTDKKLIKKDKDQYSVTKLGKKILKEIKWISELVEKYDQKDNKKSKKVKSTTWNEKTTIIKKSITIKQPAKKSITKKPIALVSKNKNLTTWVSKKVVTKKPIKKIVKK